MQPITFPLSQVTLHGLQFGDRQRPLIIALHGWLDNAASFSLLAPLLDDYCVIAIDLAGHGHSEHRSADANYHLLDWVQDIHELFTTQQWSSVILLGHSLGGIIASLYTASFPESVSKLITIESFGPLTDDPATSASQLRQSIQSRLAILNKPARHPASLREAVMARKVAGDLSWESAKILVERNIRETKQGLHWRTDRRLRTQSSLRLTEAQAEGFLSQIQCPTLVISGQDGFVKVLRNITRRQNWLADLHHQCCPGGHHLHLDEPQAVAQAIKTFLNR